MKHRRLSEQLKRVVESTQQDISKGMKVMDACKKHKLEPSLYYVKMRQYASSNPNGQKMIDNVEARVKQEVMVQQDQNSIINSVQAQMLKLERENQKLKKIILDNLLAS